MRCLVLGSPACAYGMNRRARRCSNANAIRIVFEAALDAVTGRQKCVEALDQVRMPGKEFRDSADNSRRVDPACISAPVTNDSTKADTYVWLLKSFIMSRNLL